MLHLQLQTYAQNALVLHLQFQTYAQNALASSTCKKERCPGGVRLYARSDALGSWTSLSFFSFDSAASLYLGAASLHNCRERETDLHCNGFAEPELKIISISESGMEPLRIQVPSINHVFLCETRLKLVEHCFAAI